MDVYSAYTAWKHVVAADTLEAAALLHRSSIRTEQWSETLDAGIEKFHNVTTATDPLFAMVYATHLDHK
jgi:hypothetical protein